MSQGTPKSLQGFEVMVVDDDATFRRYLEAQLEMLGCRTVSVENGREAWERIQITAPDLVLTDVFMPGLSGLELCARIKAHPELASIPVVLLTSVGAQSKDEGYKVGADDFINKPPHLLELRTRLHNLLALHSLKQVEMACRAPLLDEKPEPFKIAVLESFGILRHHVQKALEEEGIQATAIGTLDAFFEGFPASTPDLLILDQDLIEMPGSAFASILRTRADTESMSILLMFEADAAGQIQQGLADEHLMKPFDAFELKSRVRAMLQRLELKRRQNTRKLRVDPNVLKDPESGAFSKVMLFPLLDVCCQFAAFAGQPMGLLALRFFSREMAPREIRAVAGLFQQALMPTDVLCRYDEQLLIAILPGVRDRSLIDRASALGAQLDAQSDIRLRGQVFHVIGQGEKASELLRKLWAKVPRTDG